MLSSFLFVCTNGAAPATAEGDPGEEGESKIDWAVILSNPQNIGILFGMLMVVLVIIYCLWKKICQCLDIIWNSFVEFLVVLRVSGVMCLVTRVREIRLWDVRMIL